MFNKYVVMFLCILIGLSGWSIFWATVWLKKMHSPLLQKMGRAIEKPGAILIFGLPVAILALLQHLFGKIPNFWIYREYSGWSIATMLSPFLLLSVGLIRSLFVYKKSKKDLRKDGTGYRHKIDFEEKGEKYTERYLNLEVYEDLETHQKVLAGIKSEDEYLEQVTMGNHFPGPKKGVFGFTCRKCGKKMRNVPEIKTSTAEFRFKEMEPFKIEVTGPTIICLNCGKNHVADWESLSETEDKLLEKLKLVLP